MADPHGSAIALWSWWWAAVLALGRHGAARRSAPRSGQLRRQQLGWRNPVCRSRPPDGGTQGRSCDHRQQWRQGFGPNRAGGCVLASADDHYVITLSGRADLPFRLLASPIRTAHSPEPRHLSLGEVSGGRDHERVIWATGARGDDAAS